MKIIDIIAIIIIALGGLAGFKKGAIKGLVQLVGLIAIAIVAYQFRGFLATFFIKNLPFFNFAGSVEGMYAINLLVYEGAAFLIIFVLLYCLLNILITISGLFDILVKLTIVLEIPSKIIGTILGLLESIIFVFVVGVVLLQFGQTQKLVADSVVVKGIVERTPIVKDVFSGTIASGERIYNIIEAEKDSEDKKKANIDIVRELISYGIVDSKLVQDCIDNGKLHMDNVIVAS